MEGRKEKKENLNYTHTHCKKSDFILHKVVVTTLDLIKSIAEQSVFPYKWLFYGATECITVLGINFAASKGLLCGTVAKLSTLRLHIPQGEND